MTEKKDNLPDPLVPAEVDLRGYEFMPYYGDRLRESDLNSRATDAEYRAAHNLWWSAWKQVPAASLPSDDVTLARLADLGRDVRSWEKVKDRALHGFVICSDGRYYHRVLSAVALESWEGRKAARDRTAAARAARLLKTQQQPVSQTSPPSAASSVTEKNRSVTSHQATATATAKGTETGKAAAAKNLPTGESGPPGNGRSLAAAAGLIYPENLSQSEIGEASKALNGKANAQVLLDELAGAMAGKRPVANPIALLVSFIAKDSNGQFKASHASRIQAEREHLQAQQQLAASGRDGQGRRVA